MENKNTTTWEVSAGDLRIAGDDKSNEMLVSKTVKALEILYSDSKFERNIRFVRFIYKIGFPSFCGEMRCRRGNEWYLIHGNEEIFLGIFKDKFINK